MILILTKPGYLIDSDARQKRREFIMITLAPIDTDQPMCQESIAFEPGTKIFNYKVMCVKLR